MFEPLDSERVFGDDPSMGRTRVRRRRLTVAMVLVGVVMLGTGSRAWSRPATADGSTPPAVSAGGMAVRDYVVAPGDTIWGIASSALPGGDPRPIVRAIELLNHVRAGELVPGQTLRIPVVGEEREPASG
jgi:nucleoid-associated protein YgaU